MQQVFLSYTYDPHPDHANEAEELRRRAITVIEAMDLHVATGEDLGGEVLTNEIKERIDKADALVALVTPWRDGNGNKVAPPRVNDEFKYAKAKDKRAFRISHPEYAAAGRYVAHEYTTYSIEKMADALMKLMTTLALWKKYDERPMDPVTETVTRVAATQATADAVAKAAAVAEIQAAAESTADPAAAAMATRPKTFVCYSSVDEVFVVRLYSELRRAGVDVWVDKINIPIGARWDDEVEAALNMSTRMLVVLSPSSVVSQNVKDEISNALRRDIEIVPVLHQECNIPFRIERFQYVDLKTNYDTGLRMLLQRLGVQELVGTKQDDDHPSSRSPVQRPKLLIASLTVIGVAAAGVIAIRLWPDDQPAGTPTAVVKPAPSRLELESVASGARRPDPGVVTFYFAIDSAALNPDAAMALADVIETVKGGKRAVISGFNDSSDNREERSGLAWRRTLGVRKVLMDAGIAEDRIEMKMPKVITTSTVGEARRVEVKAVN